MEQTEAGPWDLKLVLALDGGGIRGYASLLILQKLMEKVQKLELNHPDGSHDSSFCPRPPHSKQAIRPLSQSAPPRTETASATTQLLNRRRSLSWFFRPTVSGSKTPLTLPDSQNDGQSSSPTEQSGYLPCHYFDYIGGASTGGVNAIMLSRLRMSIADCIRIFPIMAERIFSKRSFSIGGLLKDKYDSGILEEELRRIVSERTGSLSNLSRFPSPPDLCRTAVVSRRITEDDRKDEAYLFRTYDHFTSGRWPPSNPGEADDYEISEVAQATAAAPTYFKAVKLKNPANPSEPFEFTDGGVCNNNPSRILLDEIVRKEKSAQPSQCARSRYPIHLLLSVGTGQFRTKSGRLMPKRRLFGLFRHLRDRMLMVVRLRNAVTDPDEADENVRLRMEDEANRLYFRLNGGSAIADLKLDDWTDGTKHIIEKEVKEYLDTDGVKEEIKRCAAAMVEHRRKRIRDADRWTRFTYCTTIRCPYCDSSNKETRALLKKHIESDHADKLSRFNVGEFDNFISDLPLAYPTITGGPF